MVCYSHEINKNIFNIIDSLTQLMRIVAGDDKIQNAHI